MQINIYTEKDRRTTAWSGGTTTELWIYPQGSDYASRNFGARISSATVNLRESDFTILTGVVRYITPLSGGFTLTHADGSSVALAPLDKPYRFDGGIATHCIGTATDFNLMLKGLEGSMEILRGRMDIGGGLCCIYPVLGEVKVNGKTLGLKARGLAEIHLEAGESAVIEAAEAIVCKIRI